MTWPNVPLTDVVKDVTSGNAKIMQKEYLQEGALPVIDQGKEFIGGYVDDVSLQCKEELPVVIFGDHTREVKFVDQPFALGADGVKVLKPIAGVLDEKYLYYVLKQAKLPEDAGYSRHFKFVKRLQIPLPPLEEQKRIAAILDKADTIRRKRQQAIDLTDQLLRSVFLDMFGDPKVDWETVSFIEVAKPEKNTFVNGPFGSNLLTSELKDEGVPVLYIQDIRSGRYNRRSNKHVTELKAKELSSCNVFPGDVLIAKVGDPPGAAAVYPKDEPNAIITQDVVRIRPDLKRVTPEFVAGFLNSSIGERWLAPIIVEATRSRFGLGGIKKKTFVMPPTSLQHKYSEIHKQIESERRRMLLGLKNSQNLFNSMAKNVFKGQLNKPTKTA